MSVVVEPSLRSDMTAEEFFVWAQTWPDGDRFELIDGRPSRLYSERVSHSERKLSAVIALRDALKRAGNSECRAFPDGVSVRIGARTVREPDAAVQCGPYDVDGLFLPNPVVVVEIVSPSSVRTDAHRKLIDYFLVPSILHYLVVYGDDGRVVHHRRDSSAGEIVTLILGRDDTIDLAPLGLLVAVEALLGD